VHATNQSLDLVDAKLCICSVFCTTLRQNEEEMHYDRLKDGHASGGQYADESWETDDGYCDEGWQENGDDVWYQEDGWGGCIYYDLSNCKYTGGNYYKTPCDSYY